MRQDAPDVALTKFRRFATMVVRCAGSGLPSSWLSPWRPAVSPTPVRRRPVRWRPLQCPRTIAAPTERRHLGRPRATPPRKWPAVCWDSPAVRPRPWRRRWRLCASPRARFASCAPPSATSAQCERRPQNSGDRHAPFDRALKQIRARPRAGACTLASNQSELEYA